MHIARVIYCMGSNPLSPVIKYWPDSGPARWSHSGIVIGDDDVGGIEPSYVWHTTWGKGLHSQKLYSFLYQYYKDHRVVSYLVEAPFEEQKAWCEKRNGMPYAKGTVIGRLFGLRSSEEKADECAEVVENFLRDMRVVGGPRWREGHHLMTPNVSFNNLCGVAR